MHPRWACFRRGWRGSCAATVTPEWVASLGLNVWGVAEGGHVIYFRENPSPVSSQDGWFVYLDNGPGRRASYQEAEFLLQLSPDEVFEAITTGRS